MLPDGIERGVSFPRAPNGGKKGFLTRNTPHVSTFREVSESSSHAYLRTRVWHIPVVLTQLSNIAFELVPIKSGTW